MILKLRDSLSLQMSFTMPKLIRMKEKNKMMSLLKVSLLNFFFAENEFPKGEIAGHKIIELKSNFIPKGLVPLERIFTKDDTPSKPVVQSSEDNVVDCNIGSAEHPKIVKISKSLSAEQRNRYIKLLKEHVDVFSWSYEELRTYDT